MSAHPSSLWRPRCSSGPRSLLAPEGENGAKATNLGETSRLGAPEGCTVYWRQSSTARSKSARISPRSTAPNGCRGRIRRHRCPTSRKVTALCQPYRLNLAHHRKPRPGRGLRVSGTQRPLHIPHACSAYWGCGWGSGGCCINRKTEQSKALAGQSKALAGQSKALAGSRSVTREPRLGPCWPSPDSARSCPGPRPAAGKCPRWTSPARLQLQRRTGLAAKWVLEWVFGKVPMLRLRVPMRAFFLAIVRRLAGLLVKPRPHAEPPPHSSGYKYAQESHPATWGPYARRLQ